MCVRVCACVRACVMTLRCVSIGVFVSKYVSSQLLKNNLKCVTIK